VVHFATAPWISCWKNAIIFCFTLSVKTAPTASSARPPCRRQVKSRLQGGPQRLSLAGVLE
jgi:hypothetical protein